VAQWCNAPSLSKREPHYVSYRTILWVIQSPVRLEAIRAAIEASMPTVHAILLAIGSTDGTAGGLDLTQEATRTYIQSLVGDGTGATLTQAEADALCSLGVRMISPAESAGLPPVLEDDVTRARSLS
jgi:hypothetical protein